MGSKRVVQCHVSWRPKRKKKKGNVLFNDALNIFYFTGICMRDDAYKRNLAANRKE